MPVLKGALHVHTTMSDGALTPEKIIEIYRDLGFDFMAITDHDFLIKPDYFDRIPQDCEGILVFRGVELTVFAQGYMHVTRVDGDTERLHIFNHPAECDLPVARVKSIIEEVAEKLPLDCVEITSKGFYTPDFDVSEIPYPKIATDDSHESFGCGRAWIEVDCALDNDTILREIKAGRARNVFR